MPISPTFERAVEFAQELIRIPSLPGAEEAIALRVLDEMRALGFEEVRADEVGNVIGVIRGRGEAPAVALNCHLDHVAVGDESAWEHPPFAGVIAEGALHGRGAMDIKGPLALQTYAAAALGSEAPGDLVVAHTVFEERGGWGMDHLLSVTGLRPAAVIIGEATHGDVAIGHRGRAEVEIVLRGRAGHASAPERALNALDLLPTVLEAVGELSAGLRKDPLLGPSSVAPTNVRTAPGSANVIPDEVVVTLDWRILPGDGEALLDRVREVITHGLGGGLPAGFGAEVRFATERQRSYTGLEEERRLLTPGFLLDPGHPVAEAAAAAVGRRDRGTGPAILRPWTFATDGGWSRGIHGIPTLGFAPGEERYAHTNVERLDLDEARWAFERYPALIRAVQRAVA